MKQNNEFATFAQFEDLRKRVEILERNQTAELVVDPQTFAKALSDTRLIFLKQLYNEATKTSSNPVRPIDTMKEAFRSAMNDIAAKSKESPQK